jgi:hypothetical protein
MRLIVSPLILRRRVREGGVVEWKAVVAEGETKSLAAEEAMAKEEGGTVDRGG